MSAASVGLRIRINASFASVRHLRRCSIGPQTVKRYNILYACNIIMAGSFGGDDDSGGLVRGVVVPIVKTRAGYNTYIRKEKNEKKKNH